MVDSTFQDCLLVRVGLHGQVGRFLPTEPLAFRRGQRVVCRTERGIEVGHILQPSARLVAKRLPDGAAEAAMENGTSQSNAGKEGQHADGRVIRPMAPEDELLYGHLQELGHQAQAACQTWLEQRQISAVLLDVEPLLDGKTLYFHFLSEIDERVQQHLDELVAVYEQQVRESRFANLLEQGCGPGCGTTEAKNGCGSKGGCAVCKVAAACKR